jgi:NHLM bacteriocin system ABC transporter peptidase/ATP-binding protein
MEALECGAAALAMVLAHHGLWVPLEELRSLCGVSRDGSKAVNILKAARSLGMDAAGYRKEPEELRDLPLPAILFVNMNHFVVLEGCDTKGYRLNDPALGKRRVSPGDFDGMFSGIVLVFQPTPTFQPGGAPRGVLPALSTLARGSTRPMTLVVMAGFLMVALTMVTPAFQMAYLDKVMIGGLHDWTVPLLIGIGAVIPLIALLSYLRARLSTFVGTKLSIVLSSRMMWHVLRLPMTFFAQRHAGMVTSRIDMAEDLGGLAANHLGEAVVNAIMVIAFTLVMLQYNATLTLICVLFSAVNILVFHRIRRSLGTTSESIAMRRVKVAGKTMQGLRMMETLKATGTEGLFLEKWRGLLVQLVNAEQAMARRDALLGSLPALTASLTAAAVLVTGGAFAMGDGFTIGMLVAFTTLLGSFTRPVESLVELAATLRGAQGPLAQVDDTLRHARDNEFAGEGRGDDPTVSGARGPAVEAGAIARARYKRLSGHLKLEGVTFGYSHLDDPLIRDFSLEMPPGARVALVGGSGSGKSTLGKLVAGLLEPWNGAILFDGIPRERVPRDISRNSLAVVDQDIVLFAGTIRDNITMWDPAMPRDQMVQAAKDAMIHDVILSRKGGYEATVAENGANFSGGQRQRLEIARALVGNPSLLVLDEATSALDPVTEKAVVDNLRRRGCGCLIIAHRLSTIRDCDQIIVLDRGRILQSGTHDDLVAVDGPYRHLIET